MKKYKVVIYSLLLVVAMVFSFSLRPETVNGLGGKARYEKLDAKKDLVHLSKQVQKLKIRDYKLSDGQIQTGVVIRIPNLTIKSADARYFNSQMENFARYTIQNYKNKIKDGSKWYSNVDYKVYRKGDLLSLVIFSYDNEGKKKYSRLEDYSINDLSVINIDLNTGRKLSEKEMLQKFELHDFEERIIAYIHSQFPLNDVKNGDRIAVAKHKFGISKSMEVLWRGLYERKPTGDKDTTYWVLYGKSDRPNLFYSEQEKALLANVKLISYEGKKKNFQTQEGGFLFKNADISKIEPKKTSLNPTYEYYAKKKGIDPTSKSAPLLLSGFIGYSQSKDVPYLFQGIMEKAKPDLQKLSFMETQHPGEQPIKGDELYILIPKYEEVSLFYLVVEPDMEKDQASSFYSMDSMGDMLLKANFSDLFSDCEITVTYKDRKFKYEPYQSLKDGSNMVVDGVADITDVIEKDRSKQVGEASKFLSEFIYP